MNPTTPETDPPEHVLVVDDESGPRELLAEVLSIGGLRCDAVGNAEEAMRRLRGGGIDLVFTDMQMPGQSGLDLIEEIRRIDDSIPVILITGYPSVNTAVDAMKRGAVDFLPKPFDFNLVTHMARKALQERRLRKENRRLQEDANRAEVIERLNRELNAKLEELTRLYSISESMTQFMDSDQIFEHIVRVAGEVTGAKRVSIMMLDRSRRYLRIRAAQGLPEKVKAETRVPVGSGIAGEVARDGRPMRVAQRTDSPSAGEGGGSSYESHSWLSLPLHVGGRVYGVLNVTDKMGRENFTAKDEQIMAILLEKAGAKLENQALYEGIYANLVDTLNTLVTTIEAKDPYTREHSLRVTNYALQLAGLLGLDQQDREMIDFAGTLHDIGKIGVHDEILCKTGGLTDAEYEAIKAHPLIGERIVEPLGLTPTERAIIRNHHERFDGRGYPDGLGGEDIPLLARIVSVADAFDAMTTTRSYRRALSAKSALEEVRQQRGKQFDPVVADALLEAAASGLIVVAPQGTVTPVSAVM
jgi:putative nucleotidyltransferase with HDIG domain